METVNWKKNIAMFMTSQAISLFGSSLVQFAIIWYVAKETQSGVMVTLLTLCGFLPQVFVSLFAGVWADRCSRKALIIAADAGIALFTLALVFIIMNTEDFFWALLVVSAIRSVGAGIQTPAVSAMIPQLVPPDKLMRVSGINGSVQSMINLVAPAVSGAMLSWGAFHNLMLVDVVTAAIGISIFLMVPVEKHRKAMERQKGGYFDDLKAGLQYSFGNRFLRRLLCVSVCFCFLIVPAGLLNELLVIRVFGGNYWYLTLSEMAFFIGALVGGLILGVWGGFSNRLKTLGFGGIAFGITTIAIGVVDVFWVYLAIMVIVGIAMPFNSTPLTVLIQERVDSDMQGRVFSLFQIISSLILPMGMAFFGPMADVIPIQWLMVGSGTALLMMTAAVFSWKSFYREGTAPKTAG